VLPHVVSFNARAVPEKLAPVAEILRSAGPGQGLFDLAKRIGAPTALSDIGMPPKGWTGLRRSRPKARTTIRGSPIVRRFARCWRTPSVAAGLNYDRVIF